LNKSNTSQYNTKLTSLTTIGTETSQDIQDISCSNKSKQQIYKSSNILYLIVLPMFQNSQKEHLQFEKAVSAKLFQ